MSYFFEIFIVGLSILIVAILTNFLANLLGIETWYSFIEETQNNGFLNTLKTKWAHLFFLLFIYPLILGLAAYATFKLFD